MWTRGDEQTNERFQLLSQTEKVFPVRFGAFILSIKISQLETCNHEAMSRVEDITRASTKTKVLSKSREISLTSEMRSSALG